MFSLLCSMTPRKGHLTALERQLLGSADENLMRLGIRQEVQRSFTGMHNFSMTVWAPRQHRAPRAAHSDPLVPQLSVISVPMGVAGASAGLLCAHSKCVC